MPKPFQTSLVTRNIWVGPRRTSVRLEPEVWEAVYEIAECEGVTMPDLMADIDMARTKGGLTSAIRSHVVKYLREAAKRAPEDRRVAA